MPYRTAVFRRVINHWTRYSWASIETKRTILARRVATRKASYFIWYDWATRRIASLAALRRRRAALRLSPPARWSCGGWKLDWWVSSGRARETGDLWAGCSADQPATYTGDQWPQQQRHQQQQQQVVVVIRQGAGGGRICRPFTGRSIKAHGDACALGCRKYRVKTVSQSSTWF